MKNLKVKIYTLGCKVNQYDSGRLAAELESAGFVIVKNAADTAIISSCAVTKTAMIKSQRMIKLARMENPKAKIVLAGCWSRITDQKIEGVDLVIKSGDFKRIAKEIFNFQFSIFKQFNNFSIIKTNKYRNSAMTKTDKARYFIKIQDGCEQYCTYCIVPYTRGKLKSRAEREVVEEVKRAAAAGYEEIVLSGIHLGLYGKEKRLSLRATERSEAIPGSLRFTGDCFVTGAPRNDSLAGLIKKIIKIPGLGRVRLSSIEITEVTDKLVELMRESGKICRHLHLPLQSGCDKILKLMNRPYTTANYELRIANIKKAIPGIAITTDVIVGFPGETEKDFKQTYDLIKKIKFSRLHVFPFSAHAKTPAAKMPGQVAEKIKIRRAEKLRRLGARLADEYRRKFKGRELDVVVEIINGNKLIGKTEYYFDVEIDNKQNDKNLIGEIIKVKI